MYKIIGADKKEYGPVTADQIRQWIAEGRANGQTMVQAEGSTEWKPLASFPEFTPAPGPQPAASMGAPLPASPAVLAGSRPSIPNYLVFAILCTICCCLPAGIPAIVYAAQVNSKLDMGDIAGATKASNNAKMWCWISFGAGVVVAVMYIIIFATSGFNFPQGF
jgi:hypothetical protein